MKLASTYFIKCSELQGKNKKTQHNSNLISPDSAYKTQLQAFSVTYLKVLHIGFAYSFYGTYD